MHLKDLDIDIPYRTTNATYVKGSSPRELASKMTQPGRNFFKYISYTVGTRILYRFQISTASNMNLWGEEIMAINTDMGRTSKSHKLLKNLFSFLSETIAL